MKKGGKGEEIRKGRRGKKEERVEEGRKKKRGEERTGEEWKKLKVIMGREEKDR